MKLGSLVTEMEEPHHLEGELLLIIGDLNWEVHLNGKIER